MAPRPPHNAECWLTAAPTSPLQQPAPKRSKVEQSNLAESRKGVPWSEEEHKVRMRCVIYILYMDNCVCVFF